MMIVGNREIYKSGLRSVKNLRILDIGNQFGTMTTKADFFDKGMSYEKRKAIFLNRRAIASYDYNLNEFEFNPKKVYQPTQSKDITGSSIVLTDEMVKAEDDGWDLDINADILIVTDKTPSVVAGFAVSDCPCVIASDLKNGVTATAHCGTYMIDKYLPKMTIESLQSRFDSKLDDIYVYIGACAGKNYTYDRVPSWANEDFWFSTGAIKEVKEKGRDLYKIDIKKALLSQLNPDDFESFIMSHDDTMTNPNYYSNTMASIDPKKSGRGFQGAYYKKMSK